MGDIRKDIKMSKDVCRTCYGHGWAYRAPYTGGEDESCAHEGVQTHMFPQHHRRKRSAPQWLRATVVVVIEGMINEIF